MKRQVKYGLAAVTGVITVGVFVATHGEARRADSTSVVTGAVDRDTGVLLEDWMVAGAPAVMPEQGLVDIRQGAKISIRSVGGLDSVSATLNETPLRVERSADAFDISVGGVEGAGAAQMLITESFVNGQRITIPYTVFLGEPRAQGDTDLVSAGELLSGITKTDWGNFGFEGGVEGDLIGPAGIGLLPDGRVLVLDTVNGRVVAVGPTGESSSVRELPTKAFSALVSAPGGETVLALDQINGLAVEVLSGVTYELGRTLQMLPLGVRFSLDRNGDLFVRNPGDSQLYSIATRTSTGMTAAKTAVRLDGPRVWVVDNKLEVQVKADVQPMTITVSDAGEIGVLDMVPLADGRFVVLVATLSGGQSAFNLLVIGGPKIENIRLGSVAVWMGSPISAQGTSVTIASDDSYHLVLSSFHL